jgi:hypothetical protein
MAANMKAVARHAERAEWARTRECVFTTAYSRRHSLSAYLTASLNTLAVCSSAGKKVSSASSASVMSIGVPNTVVVLMKLSTTPFIAT